VEGISIPDIPDVPSPDIRLESGSAYSVWRLYNSRQLPGDGAAQNRKYKKYSHAARIRQIEGSVTVRFVITSEGDIKSANIVKTIGSRPPSSVGWAKSGIERQIETRLP
jgi:hypothetical protein